MGDGAFFEVLAEGEVAGHLEECVVAGGNANFLNIQSSNTLLDTCGGAVGKRRRLLTQEIRLKRHHARIDK